MEIRLSSSFITASNESSVVLALAFGESRPTLSPMPRGLLSVSDACLAATREKQRSI